MRTLAGIVICFAICCSGCGESGPKRAVLHAVSGKVTSGGKPLTGCTIMFNTINPLEGQEPGYSGILGANGDYTLMDTAHNAAGAAAGKYKITFISSAESAKAAMMGGPAAVSPFPKEFATVETSPKEVEVKAGANTINIDI